MPVAEEFKRNDVNERFDWGSLKSSSNTWKCSFCNYVFKGDKPPDICPFCHHHSEFEIIKDYKDFDDRDWY